MRKSFNIGCIIITLFSLCFPLVKISAQSSYGYINGDAVRLRKNPSTKNSDILDTLNTNNQVIVLDGNKISGDGCNEGWLQVKYGENTGYVCSVYVSSEPKPDKYGRPWNTPEKAIIGGAKFIANSYISKGQYTSYLKKFNVNPNGSYAVYNHEYQANIMAPSSEALSSWKAYDKSGSMDLPFIFTIPVFDGMKESYLHPAGKSANLSTTNETDDAFEVMIKDFPDSYKPYLRDLHKEHPSWVFKPLMTGLDFETAVSIEKQNGSIHSSQSNKTKELDGNGNPKSTGEANFYYPNFAATAYYMDPRNFLNESYVFQFEDLSYSDVFSESVIQTVLNKNDLLKGYDLIDNKTYASIYLQAGKEAGVNPVYLASLSVQEVGSQKLLTTGEEFIYENVTYSGLFNYYNIGASSSASNPLRKGLVYASGGLCTLCGSYTQTNTTQPVSSGDNVTIISNLGAKTSGSYIKGFNVGEAISTLNSKTSGIKFSEQDIIKTGMTLTLDDGTSYTVVVYGDLSGDGKINSADLLKLRQHLLGTSTLSGAYLEAAKVNGNDTINSANLLKVRQYLLGTNNISQG